MGDSMTKFREDNEVENSEQKSLSLEEVKEKVRQIINQSQDLKYDLSFSASGVMDILNSIDDTPCMTGDFESTDGELNLSHREIIEEIIEEVAEKCYDNINDCSDCGDDYVDSNNCEFSIYNSNEIELQSVDLEWGNIAGLINTDSSSSDFQDIVDKHCGIDYPFKDGDTYYIICDDNRSVDYKKILTKTWDEEARKKYNRNDSYYKSIAFARERIRESLDNNYDDEYVEMEVIHTETETTSDCEWTEEVYSKEKVKLYDPATKYDDRLVYMTKREAEIYSRNLFEQYPSYPFNEGDDYWTIEDGVVVKSCWDEQSEALHRDNLNKVYYKTQDDAETFLVELSKEAIENEVG